MHILAFDTCSGVASVAIWSGDAVRVYLEEPRQSVQAEMLMPLIEQALAESSLSYDALDALAVSIGPGSFTGVRIGLATARGIALAAKKPLIGVSTLEALAWIQLKDTPKRSEVDAVLDARRGQVYFQRFDGALSPLCEAQLRPAEEFAGLTLPPVPDARAVAGVAAKRAAAGEYKENASVRPLYVRPPDAKLPQNAAIQ